MKELVRFRDHIRAGNIPPSLVLVGAALTLPTFICIGLMFAIASYRLATGAREGLAINQFWKAQRCRKLMVYAGLLWVCAAIREQLPFVLCPYEHGGVSASSGILSCVVLPALFYLLGLQSALVTGKAFAKVSRDKDQAEQQRRMQRWVDGTYRGFMAAFALSLIAMFCMPSGVGDWLVNWLLAALRDANMPARFGEVTTNQFVIFAKVVGILATGIALYSPAVQASAFLTAYSKQMSVLPLSKGLDTFLSMLRAPYTELKLGEKHPFMQNTSKTFLWLIACYLMLFGLIGFTGGSIGTSINSWLDHSIASAGTGMIYGATANPHLRIFCAAIVALYGTVPLAVTGSIFLPYLKPRRIVLSTEGVMFPDGPLLALRLRPMRLWSDFQSIEVKFGSKQILDNKTRLIIKFISGGSLSILARQLDKSSLDKLLAAVDEHAANCLVSDSVVALRANLRAQIAVYGNQSELGTIKSENYQSTIFVPHDRGSWLPNGESRVVRLLASRPLSCVYLVRMNSGQLAIAKQFFLADTNEAPDELRKTFEREYGLLKQIDHPQVSKVLDVFHRDESTYLLIEHASGIDLHKLVAAEGAQCESTVLRWAIEVCNIMIALHGQNPPIVHRDLTPDNLILADDGTIRVIDFGAGHQFMEGITGTIIGKQCYVSPEQLQGQAGPQSDIYSFGCTLHYWLTAQEPIALTPSQPQLTQSVSDQLNDLVMACTQFDLSDRPQTFAQLKEQLIKIQEYKDQAPKEILRKLAAAISTGDVQQALEQTTKEEPSCVIELKQKQEQWVDE